MHRGYPADARLWRLRPSLVAALTSADGRRDSWRVPPRLPRLNLSHRVSCTNACTNLVADVRVRLYQAVENGAVRAAHEKTVPGRRLATAHTRQIAAVDLDVGLRTSSGAVGQDRLQRSPGCCGR